MLRVLWTRMVGSVCHLLEYHRLTHISGAKAVYVLGRREASLKEVAETAVNKNIIPIQCDVTSKSDLKAAAARIQQEQGFVNFLLANSGIVRRTIYLAIHRLGFVDPC